MNREQNKKPFFICRYLLVTVDPVHVGTGGYRLGRVDLSIVREPGTRLPKIPGTSFSGAIRSYAAYRFGKRRCAGQGQPREGNEGHCGRPTCPICYTFGTAREEGGGFSGVVSIGDARLLLFPVYSMAGPVWVSTRSILEEAGWKVDPEDSPVTTMNWDRPLNLGWLMIEKPGKADMEPPAAWKDAKEWREVRDRIVVLPEKLFSQVVNSNLEVRTSVSIDPDTGAAREGALFTYEAIPRATFLWLDVVVDDYRQAFPSRQRLEEWKRILEGKDVAAKKRLLTRWGLWKENEGNGFPEKTVEKALAWVKNDLEYYSTGALPQNTGSWRFDPARGDDLPSDVVASAMEWLEHLGVGGMGTRGFGRIRAVGGEVR